MLNYWLALSVLEGIGLVTKHKLLNIFGTPDRIFEEKIKKADFPRIKEDIDLRTVKSDYLKTAEIIIGQCKEKNAEIICFDDENYPKLLRETGFTAPLILYCKGNGKILCEKSAAIVGTREPNGNGRKDTRVISSGLAQNGFVIVSGLARGVDTIAHNSTLEAGGKTIAVMATGIDRISPAQNTELARMITEKGGALITERRPGEMPHAPNFVQRNRIISGLSQCSIIVSAPEKSGALITADFAQRQNRKVFVVPGTISDEKYKGSNKLLLKKIIDPALTIDGILCYINGTKKPEQIGIFDIAIPQNGKKIDLPKPQENLLSFFGKEPVSLEELSQKSGIDTVELYGALLDLELEGIIYKTAQDKYFI